MCLGDDLFSRQPICEAVLAEGLHFLFVCKPDSHPAIEAFRTGIVPDTLPDRRKHGKTTTTYCYQWLCGVPLRGDAKAIDVNWFSVEIADAKGKVTPGSSPGAGSPQQLRHRYGGRAGQCRGHGRGGPNALEGLCPRRRGSRTKRSIR